MYTRTDTVAAAFYGQTDGNGITTPRSARYSLHPDAR